MNNSLKRLTALGTLAAIGGVGAAAALSQPSDPSGTDASTTNSTESVEVRTEAVRETEHRRAERRAKTDRSRASDGHGRRSSRSRQRDAVPDGVHHGRGNGDDDGPNHDLGDDHGGDDHGGGDGGGGGDDD